MKRYRCVSNFGDLSFSYLLLGSNLVILNGAAFGRPKYVNSSEDHVLVSLYSHFNACRMREPHKVAPGAGFSS